MTRAELPEKLVQTKAVVLLPACTLDEAIAPVEVLIQEGLAIVSLPPESKLTPQQLRAAFGPRLLVGAHDVRTTADAQRAVTQQAAFALLLPSCEPEGCRVLAAAQIACLPPALTPTEVATVWQAGAAGVQVVPASTFSTSYAAQLTALVPQALLVTRGADSSYDVKAWIDAGVVGVCLGERLLGDAFRRGDLGALRTRARPLVEAIRSN